MSGEPAPAPPVPAYPVNLRLEGRSCLVVGAGRVAAQKVAGLLECGAAVTVVAPEVGAEVEALAAAGVDRPAGSLHVERRAYRSGEATDHRYVVTATGRTEVDHQVFLDADGAGVWVNSADDPANCTATLPARLRQGPVLVTFSTGGTSPALSTWLRRRFAPEVGPEYATLAEVLAEERRSLREQGRSTEGLDWQSALDSGMLDLIRSGRVAEARGLLHTCLSSSSD